jgi:hypothetical protein
VERAVFLTVLHRLFASGSDRAAERWFGIFARNTLRGANFKNIHELREAIEAYLAAYAEIAKPFVWRKREVQGVPIQRDYRKLKQLSTRWQVVRRGAPIPRTFR